MRFDEVELAAKRLFDQWGLTNQQWQFAVDYGPRTRRLGVCDFGNRTIKVTAWYIEMNGPDLVFDTLKHEIAHALAWIHNQHGGHGSAWVKWCGIVGCKASRLKLRETIINPPPQYSATCDNCGKTFTRSRMLPRTKVSWCKCQEGVEMTVRKYLRYGINPAYTASVVGRRQAAESMTGESSKIAKIIEQLASTRDKATGKRLRDKLRRLGHPGGLR